jgi:hypothetical protein
VHDQGHGHLNRMTAVAESLRSDITVLSSMPAPARSRLRWVTLAPDDLERHPADVTARGTLHWVPRHDNGLLRRTTQIIDWIEAERPSLLVVDVSVEVTLLSRLAGVPVVVVMMPGRRTDRAHTQAYDLADALLAAWPGDVPLDWPRHWLDKTVFVGGISRFDRLARPLPESGRTRARAFLLWGAGGHGLPPDALAAARAATPGWHWETAGVTSTKPGSAVWRELCAADVVVAHAGQNTVAELAAARAPAVVVADERPFGEQQHMVRMLRHLGIGVALDRWPPAAAWPRLLQQASETGGQPWARWSSGAGGREAARLLDRLADDLAATPAWEQSG